MKSGPAEKPKVSATPKPEPKKVEPEEIKFEPTKQRQHYRDKYHPLTPAGLMDKPDREAVIARERLRRKAGELFRTNPAEWNKLYGGDKLDAAIKAAEDEAYAKFDEPQKNAPIVDRSINKDAQPKVDTTPVNVPAAKTSDPQSGIGKSVSGMQVAKAKDEEEKAKREAEKAKKQAEQESERAKAQGQTDASLAGEKAKREQEQRQKEQEEKREAEEAERKAKEAERKAEEELKKAEQEARKAEDERRRQEQKAEQKRRVSGSTQTVGGKVKLKPRGGPVGESAIFRAIMRK
jgi:flagellar biosynthesis GTPase FlhF